MYELLIASKNSGKILDVSFCTEDVEYETVRSGSPGKLTFKVLKAGEVSFHEGDVVRFSEDGKLQFYGWVFTKIKDRWGVIQVTCYDRLRYLKASGTYAFYAMTAGDIIRQIAGDLQIDVGDIADTGYVIPSMIKSDQPCIDIIQDALGLTLLNTGQIYILYDNGSGLSLKAAGAWRSDVIIGDKSLLTDYSYKTDIDAETFNSIKLIQPNKDTGMNDVVIAQDSYNIGRWGLLQLTQSVNAGLNTAQMQAQAEQSLAYYNRRRKTLSVSAIGVNGLRAGMLLRMMVDELGDISLDQYVLLDRVTHSWKNDEHTMELETLSL